MKKFKKLILLIILTSLITGCRATWISKEVVDKTYQMETVEERVSAPRYEYHQSCEYVTSFSGKTEMDCGYKYGWNNFAYDVIFVEKMVYKIYYEKLMNDKKTTYLYDEIVEEDEYNSVSVGDVIYSKDLLKQIRQGK